MDTYVRERMCDLLNNQLQFGGNSIKSSIEEVVAGRRYRRYTSSSRRNIVVVRKPIQRRMITSSLSSFANNVVIKNRTLVITPNSTNRKRRLRRIITREDQTNEQSMEEIEKDVLNNLPKIAFGKASNVPLHNVDLKRHVNFSRKKKSNGSKKDKPSKIQNQFNEYIERRKKRHKERLKKSKKKSVREDLFRNIPTKRSFPIRKVSFIQSPSSYGSVVRKTKSADPPSKAETNNDIDFIMKLQQSSSLRKNEDEERRKEELQYIKRKVMRNKKRNEKNKRKKNSKMPMQIYHEMLVHRNNQIKHRSTLSGYSNLLTDAASMIQSNPLIPRHKLRQLCQDYSLLQRRNRQKRMLTSNIHSHRFKSIVRGSASANYQSASQRMRKKKQGPIVRKLSVRRKSTGSVVERKRNRRKKRNSTIGMVVDSERGFSPWNSLT